MVPGPSCVRGVGATGGVHPGRRARHATCAAGPPPSRVAGTWSAPGSPGSDVGPSNDRAGGRPRPEPRHSTPTLGAPQRDAANGGHLGSSTPVGRISIQGRALATPRGLARHPQEPRPTPRGRPDLRASPRAVCPRPAPAHPVPRSRRLRGRVHARPASPPRAARAGARGTHGGQFRRRPRSTLPSRRADLPGRGHVLAPHGGRSPGTASARAPSTAREVARLQPRWATTARGGADRRALRAIARHFLYSQDVLTAWEATCGRLITAFEDQGVDLRRLADAPDTPVRARVVVARR
ncbi:hypothetical protein OERS_06790 [Oerskovia enterophila]|uniref:Uncharacterized protein n=1 Tax=Oerskovia enterophila TaxID=43678 RepID=A0ABX2Y903_9CELL|nr:hypothetical protein OERS_06790 [Oerskovia enterophila]